ncbi:M1 family peptidase [Streptomyces dengpaensis]|uniref:Aminopeptidase N n=1 Tax=Streptomyces dengpaensis TaxID=2049881 RepID=A0ABM6T2S6_9ACTN|nr:MULTISPECIES: M1 family metallopeptidase [Streptomyces]AVH61346.1 M1 family peptidase [Streptomyces dengpaensis]PIB06593.1 metallopeptidase [Streptomyces sp. HG99]
MSLALSLCLTLAVALATCGGDGSVHGKPGASGVRDPYFPKLGNGGYDVTHYGLTLSYDPKSKHLKGAAEITAKATQNLSAFNLDLKGLDVESVTVDGKDARWNHAGQELTVRPHDDLDNGKTFRATVRYSGMPEMLVDPEASDPDSAKEGWLRTADGALALGQPTGSMAWFPGNHHPSDKASYDLTITVPKGVQAVSNGELKSETKSAAGRTTYVWHTAEPMASYLATVAVGTYEITRSTTKNGLPVYVAVDPTQAEASEEVLARIPEFMEWAEGRFGPYPFSTTGAIVDRGEDVGYALETQHRSVFPGAPDTELFIHELAHQWYGDSVTPESWRDMWLNEGFATYAEWLWQEDHGGRTAEEIFDSLYKGDYYDDPDDNKVLWSFPPPKPSGAAHISDLPVYDRGAMVVHKIRQTVGDDRFYDIIQGWTAAHRHGNADTDDFTAYVEKMAPDKDFGVIWSDWLYGEGKPAKP